MNTKHLAFAILVPAAVASLIFAQFPGMPMSPAERARFQAQQRVTEADHQYVMDILHLKRLRLGADGENHKAPNYENTDEAKANPYPTLPNPLVSNLGVAITTPALWWKP